MVPLLVLLHLGALHPYEKVLTLLLAFGPFLLLGAVIVWRRRLDAREEDARDARDAGPAQRER
jgi:hypothetical protein